MMNEQIVSTGSIESYKNQQVNNYLRSSNEYLTSQAPKNPLQQQISRKLPSDINSILLTIFVEICSEIDIYIEESTTLIYEDDIDNALMHMKNANRKLQVPLP